MPLHAVNTDASLQQLLQQSAQLWRGTHNPRTKTWLSGHASLDAVLPGGGWPVGALIELLPTQAGIGELQIAIPALQALSQAER